MGRYADIIMLVIIIIFFIIIGCILFKVMMIKKKEEKNKQYEQYNQTMDMIYLNLVNEIKEIREYRHDLLKHIQTLESLVNNQEELNELTNYSKKTYQTLKSLKYQDEILNAIIILQEKSCQQKDIDLTLDIEDIVYDQINEKDKVCLIYNLFDNAIEACMKLENCRYIHFRMYKKQDIYIEIENSIEKNKRVLFKTNKTGNHGLGMGIIKETINQYNGSIEISQNEELGWMKEEIILRKG